MQDAVEKKSFVHMAKRFTVDFVLLVFLFPVRKLVGVMPWPMMYRLAEACAFLLYALSPQTRRGIKKELKRHLHKHYVDRELDQATRESFVIYVKRHFETLRHSTLSNVVADRYLRVDGFEHLEEALRNGKGAIPLLFHFGSFWMVIPTIGFRGHPLNTAIGNPELKQQTWAQKQVYKIRKRETYQFPVKWLPVNKSLKSVIKALRNNEVMVLLYDGRDGTQWIPVEFLGTKAYFAPGVLRIAAMTGAAILPTYVRRHADDTQTVVIEKPYVLQEFKDEATFFGVNTQNLARRFEQQIIEQPSHFGMIFHVMQQRYERGIFKVPFSN